MTNTIGHWGSELACIWTNYRPPCRPSNSEMVVYSKYLRELQKYLKQRPRALILGSTSEFRDWGHEENLDVTVVDYSAGYNDTIREQMKYKHIQEKFHNCCWQEMEYEDEFDLIVGDLVIGNLKEKEVPPFLKSIRKAIKKQGFFVTKSFFRNENHKIRSLEDIFTSFLQNELPYHPFPYLIYDIALSCMDLQTGILDFHHMYDSISELNRKGIVNNQLLAEFSGLGWQNNMKFEFYIPTIVQWETMVMAEMQIFKKEFGSDIYSQDFPIYIITP